LIAVLCKTYKIGSIFKVKLTISRYAWYTLGRQATLLGKKTIYT